MNQFQLCSSLRCCKAYHTDIVSHLIIVFKLICQSTAFLRLSAFSRMSGEGINSVQCAPSLSLSLSLSISLCLPLSSCSSPSWLLFLGLWCPVGSGLVLVEERRTLVPGCRFRWRVRHDSGSTDDKHGTQTAPSWGPSREGLWAPSGCAR